MAGLEVTKWNRNLKMSRSEIIRFQVIVHLHVNSIHLSRAAISCLTLLGLLGKEELIYFCEKLTEEGIFTSIQSSRNIITRLQELKLILKTGKGRKEICLHPDMQIQNKGNILVDVKCLSVEEEMIKETVIDGTEES